MKRVVLGTLALAALLVLPAAPASADDTAELGRRSSLIGEHIALRLRVLAPEGASVELAPGTPGWNGVEVVSVEDVQQVKQQEGVLWLIDARVAAFAPGEIAFQPSVAIISGSDAVIRSLPAVALEVAGTLAPDAPLELSPLAPPREIAGAESPLLRPALYGGGALGVLLLALLLWFVGRLVARRLRRTEPAVEAEPVPQTLAGAEQIIDTDPVAAYRLMSLIVKSELARRHGLRATALTTGELGKRLEVESNRWEARLVTGLLEECDSVIYAGYRPAAERRQADLNMAREIVEVRG